MATARKSDTHACIDTGAFRTGVLTLPQTAPGLPLTSTTIDGGATTGAAASDVPLGEKHIGQH